LFEFTFLPIKYTPEEASYKDFLLKIFLIGRISTEKIIATIRAMFLLRLKAQIKYLMDHIKTKSGPPLAPISIVQIS
jgi:hypothetical protein